MKTFDRDTSASASRATPTLDFPLNISRRSLLITSGVATAGALVLSFGLPVDTARAQGTAAKIAPGTRVHAFLEIRANNTVRFLSPFMEGGQGIFTAMAQIVGEELDMDPAAFSVETAPPGPDYLVVDDSMRITGGSMSVRKSYDTMRRLGATARMMLIEAGALRLQVPATELTTEPGFVIHLSSGQRISYGDLAGEAMDLPVPTPDTLKLREPEDFRWIGKAVKRLDVLEKSTGRAIYAIDIKVDGMLQAAVQHAPRLGMTVRDVRNEDTVIAMRGVHSVHRLDGAVAVVADRWWHARRAVEALQVQWQEASPDAEASGVRVMPADFSSAVFAERLVNEPGVGVDAETEGDAPAILAQSEKVLSATYESQYLRHGQLEPPSAIARFNTDGSLDVWMPNQAPEMHQADIAKLTGLDTSKINIHSPMLGGFFGRYFLYQAANPYPQAIQLAKATGRPVKLIWSREEEFLRDPMRPMSAVRFRGALDDDGMPLAIEAVNVGEGIIEATFGPDPAKVDDTAVEGLTGKPYSIANKRIAHLYVQNPATIAFWRSVGHSQNDFFYECFLDELADMGNKDPYDLRLQLLEGNARMTALLRAAEELSGGWKRGPYTAADGTRRARGVAMASPFGSHTAAIAEVSILSGEVFVHEVWQAIDPGSIVNPAVIDAQIKGAVALGLSQVLMEEAVYQNGEPIARNYDLYPILPPDRMPDVHTRIVESGEKMGGIGEPGLPAIPPAVANAVSILTGQRIRSMPLSRYTFEG